MRHTHEDEFWSSSQHIRDRKWIQTTWWQIGSGRMRRPSENESCASITMFSCNHGQRYSTTGGDIRMRKNPEDGVTMHASSGAIMTEHSFASKKCLEHDRRAKFVTQSNVKVRRWTSVTTSYHNTLSDYLVCLFNLLKDMPHLQHTKIDQHVPY